jgi:pyruvate/2-oxoglutarate dehydrogenase complex dihydrolipoamide acyltransferase (E2) component
MSVELRLERLSSEMEFGTVTAWRRRSGERVAAGEPLLEVEADKIVHEIEAPVDGVLAEVVAEEGDEVRVGAVLAVLEESA